MRAVDAGLKIGSRVNFCDEPGTIVKLPGTSFSYQGTDYSNYYAFSPDNASNGVYVTQFNCKVWVISERGCVELITKYPLIPTTFLEGVEL